MRFFPPREAVPEASSPGLQAAVYFPDNSAGAHQRSYQLDVCDTQKGAEAALYICSDFTDSFGVIELLEHLGFVLALPPEDQNCTRA